MSQLSAYEQQAQRANASGQTTEYLAQISKNTGAIRFWVRIWSLLAIVAFVGIVLASVSGGLAHR